MNVTRIYTGEDGESHFDDVEIDLIDRGTIGAISKPLAAKSVMFRQTERDYDYQWHNAPQRQFVIMLSGGGVEIEVGNGTKRRLYAGDVLLAEDTTGRGHISRAIDDEPRVSIFVPLA
ncbi:MAG: hypothetical protein P8R42_28760 [Candidatus Binatia bacterium]|nr:hypothetical protein [Candidatus Binatia bacterium]